MDSNKISDKILIAIFAILIVLFTDKILFKNTLNNYIDSIFHNKKNNISATKLPNNIPNIFDISIPINKKIANNPLTNYNYASKQQIYDARKSFVEKSIFKSKTYKPNDEVFGQIVDGKPWFPISRMVCNQYSEKAPDGFSEESRFINNPAVLLGLDLVYYFNDPYVCKYQPTLEPTEILYSHHNRTITITYGMSQFLNSLHDGYQANYKFTLNALNAVDLGYKYAYAYNVENVKFGPDAINSIIYELKYLIHLGNACKIKGGCNNGSPLQKELVFSPYSLPANIDVYLWKEKPHSTDEPYDYRCKLIFK